MIETHSIEDTLNDHLNYVKQLEEELKKTQGERDNLTETKNEELSKIHHCYEREISALRCALNDTEVENNKLYNNLKTQSENLKFVEENLKSRNGDYNCLLKSNDDLEKSNLHMKSKLKRYQNLEHEYQQLSNQFKKLENELCFEKDNRILVQTKYNTVLEELEFYKIIKVDKKHEVETKVKDAEWRTHLIAIKDELINEYETREEIIKENFQKKIIELSQINEGLLKKSEKSFTEMDYVKQNVDQLNCDLESKEQQLFKIERELESTRKQWKAMELNFKHLLNEQQEENEYLTKQIQNKITECSEIFQNKINAENKLQKLEALLDSEEARSNRSFGGPMKRRKIAEKSIDFSINAIAMGKIRMACNTTTKDNRLYLYIKNELNREANLTNWNIVLSKDNGKDLRFNFPMVLLQPNERLKLWGSDNNNKFQDNGTTGDLVLPWLLPQCEQFTCKLYNETNQLECEVIIKHKSSTENSKAQSCKLM